MNELGQVPIENIEVGEHAQRIDPEDPDTVELSESIKRVGIINPLVVVRTTDGLLLIAGHRRLVAARLAGLSVIPCFVRTSEQNVDAEISFAENFFRKDLSPVELAGALKDCLLREVMTVKELAAGFHRSEHWEGISVAAASNLVLVTDEEYRFFLLRNAVEQGATARTTAAWLQAWQAMQPPEEAIKAEPVQAGHVQQPLVPQAPCLCCSQLFEVNMMSHVPVCGACIQLLRIAGASGGVPAELPSQQPTEKTTQQR